jgi:MoxR-like ATPase
MKDWWIMRGDGQSRADWELPPLPSWRAFAARGNEGAASGDQVAADGQERAERGAAFLIDDDALDMVNTALLLRRPLLVTGDPGTGKSTLAYAIAHELTLGRVLYWPVNSRSTLHEGLYDYDAIGRLQETNVRKAATAKEAATAEEPVTPDIGSFITLGPLGTALLPAARPRVLLIDEIDKADIDLPNDLLNIFEEGTYRVPELVRLAQWQPKVTVGTSDTGGSAVITGGTVHCTEFPMVVLTSNGERDFPPAFLRRCVQLELPQPDDDKLGKIVAAHLGPEARDQAAGLITEFLARRERNILATDQLLNAVYLTAAARRAAAPDGGPVDLETVTDALLRSLGEANAV